MDRSPRMAAIVVLALLLLAAATLMAGCSQQQPLTVRVSDHPTYGKVLTDSTGRSLYIQARDVPNTGAVANLGEVGRFYPPFYAERVSGGSGINITEFGYLTRADGQRQTTFRGWPLYYYINDREPGDAKSQGANNITFVAKPDYTVMVRENVTLGVYLTDTGGRPLVSQDGDTGAGPAPGYIPFRASPVVAPSPLVQTGDFGEARGPSGDLQTTYRGRLLYSWSDGARPGAVLQNAGGYNAIIVAPGGVLTGAVEAPTASPSPSATAAPAGTPGTTVPVTTAQATATGTRSNDAYTGGEYTPTPFRTVEVVRYNTASATPSVTWTPIPSGQPTEVPTTPMLTPSAPPTTLPPTTPTTIMTSSTTVVRTTLAPIRTPTTLPTSLPPTTTTTTATTLPTTVPVPITTIPTSTASTLPVSTTLPLPFPIATPLPPNPAVSTQGGNES